ncbi:MAG: TlpA disulfide reductase family protein [Gemmatimonadales bacterium]
MQRMRRGLLQVGALASLAGTVAAQGSRTGSVAPAIDLMALDGSRVRLADYRGRPVIVTFWATWCPSCREEFPALVDAVRRHAGQELTVLAVNQRDQELREGDIGKFLAQVPVSFPVLIDRRGVSRRAYRLLGLPTTVFIDTSGVIRKVLWGPQSAGELDRAILLITAPAGRLESTAP